MADWGTIVILNGAPRSGKTSIAEHLVTASPNITPRPGSPSWVNVGVDSVMAATPERYQPGIGLRPGGERPDLEPLVSAMYATLYDSVVHHSKAGSNVVVDVGHHDNYTVPLGTLQAAANRLDGHRAMLVGVRCPLDVIMDRRESSTNNYLGWDETNKIPEPVRLWQECVHQPGIYDLEVDTSQHSPGEAALAIALHLKSDATFTALAQIRST